MATLTSHSPSLSPKPSAVFHASSNRSFTTSSSSSSSARLTHSSRLSASPSSSSTLSQSRPPTSAHSAHDAASSSSSAKAQNPAAHRRTLPSAANAPDPSADSPTFQSRPPPSIFSSSLPNVKVDATPAHVHDNPAQSSRPHTVDRGTQYTPPLYPPTYRPSHSRPHPTFPSPRHPARRERSVSRSSQGTDVSAGRGLARASLEDTDAPTQAGGPSMAASQGTRMAAPGIASTSRAPLSVQDEESSGDGEDSSSTGSSTGLVSQASPQQVQPQRSTALTQPLTRSSASSSDRAASNKRPRSDAPLEKELPRNYWDCDVGDLGVLISDMLLDLVRINDKIPLKDGQLTRFHSRAPPAISVRDYLNRLIVHATLIPPILLAMVYYIDRLCALYPAFTISSLTVHRFLISAATVAAKGLSDSFWTNNTYARVGGVSVKELALLELEFLEKMEWRIVPPNEVLIDYYRSLVERNGNYCFGDDVHGRNTAA